MYVSGTCGVCIIMYVSCLCPYAQDQGQLTPALAREPQLAIAVAEPPSKSSAAVEGSLEHQIAVHGGDLVDPGELRLALRQQIVATDNLRGLLKTARKQNEYLRLKNNNLKLQLLTAQNKHQELVKSISFRPGKRNISTIGPLVSSN